MLNINLSIFEIERVVECYILLNINIRCWMLTLPKHCWMSMLSIVEPGRQRCWIQYRQLGIIESWRLSIIERGILSISWTLMLGIVES